MGPLTLTDTYFFNRNVPDVPTWLTAFWYAATAASIFGIALLACVAAFSLRGAKRQLLACTGAPATMMIACSGIGYVFLAALALRFFYDRYILFLLLPGALLIALTAGRPSARLSKSSSVLIALILMFQATFAVVATRDYIEWNRTRWAATTALTAAGIPRTSIDGGYEFNGWFGYDSDYRSKRGKSPWWVVDNEYIIASGPLPGYSVFQTYPFRRILTRRQSDVFILHREKPN
jgi:hypothetical protein